MHAGEYSPLSNYVPLKGLEHNKFSICGHLEPPAPNGGLLEDLGFSPVSYHSQENEIFFLVTEKSRHRNHLVRVLTTVSCR